MKYSNISLVHLEKGLSVQYNGWENNKETVFSFDSNGNFIQKFTYTVDVHSNQINNILLNVDKTIVINENCFLYYSFQYQESFAHYFTQCLPKLKYYLENSDKILVVPRSTYTNLCKDIFNILEISNKKILILENNIRYIFNSLTTVEHIGTQWNGVGGEINFDGIEIYKKIRNKLKLTPNQTPHRKIYLKRDGKPNLLYGNGEIGILRKINNESELENFLLNNGFEIVELGTKSIKEKSEQLADAHTIVTQIGANCINLIFSNSIKHLLLLSNDYPIGKDYYFNLVDSLNPILCTKTIFEHPSSCYGVDLKNSSNNPFSVDIHRINDYIKNLE